MKEKRIADKIDRLIQERKKRRSWIKAVSVMAAVVVFISTYLMILPAITLSNDSDSSQTEQTEKSRAEISKSVASEANEELSTEETLSGVMSSTEASSGLVSSAEPSSAVSAVDAAPMSDSSDGDASLFSVPEEAMPLSQTKNCNYSVTIQSGDGDFTEGEEGTVSTRNFTLILMVNFSIGWQNANGNQDVFYYKLPEGAFFIPVSGKLTDNSGHEYGIYECTEDGYLIIELYENTILQYYSLSLNVRRTVEVNEEFEGKLEFENGPTINVPHNAEGGINAPHNKTVTVDENVDGSIDYSYELTITAEDRELPNLYIHDVLSGTGLSVDDNSTDTILDENYNVQLSFEGVTISRGVGSFHYGNLDDASKVPLDAWTEEPVFFSAAAELPVNTENGCSQSLEFLLDELPQGFTLTITYSVTVTDDARVQIDAEGGSYALNNLAQFYFNHPNENTPLGSSSNYTPYEGDEGWLTKEMVASTEDSVRWNLVAGTDKYTMNGMYVTDEIERRTWELGVEYLTDQAHPAEVKCCDAQGEVISSWSLTWEYVESLESLTDEQKKDNTKIYWHENSFVWYPGTDDTNQTPYTYTLTYYTSYVAEIFENTDKVNGAQVHYKGTQSGVEPDAPQLTEITLTKGMEELTNDGTVRYISEIHSNGVYAADHFVLYDYMPRTAADAGDQLTSHDRLTEYARWQDPLALEVPSLETIQNEVQKGKTAFYYDGKYILLFDTVADLEEATGMQFEVTAENGTALSDEEMLAQGDKKLIFFFNAEPFPEGMNNEYAYIFGLQFNVDIMGSTELIDGLPDSSELRAYEENENNVEYTIRISYETTAHKWGDTAYAGDAFVNRQEMHFRVPEISSVEHIQYAEAYYYFSALSDSSILNKYISSITENEDGTAKIIYTIYIDLDNVNSQNGVWIYDAAREEEVLRDADFSSVETRDAFVENASIVTSPDCLMGRNIEELIKDGWLEYVDAAQIEDEITASMSGYTPEFALHFTSTFVSLAKRRGSDIELKYPVTVNLKKGGDGTILEQGDYNLRNFVRLYTDDGNGNKSPVSESWADYGVTEDVLGKFQTVRPSAWNNHIADWRIVVNPDKIVLEDSASFTVRDRMEGGQTIIPSSIKVYGIGSDGVETEVTAECIIDAGENQDTMLLTVEGGENGKWPYVQYIIEYQTRISGNPGEIVEYNNTAEIVGMRESQDTVDDTIYMEEHGGTVVGDTARVTVNKYDKNSPTEMISGAVFKLSVLPWDKVEQSGSTMEMFLTANAGNWDEIADGTTDENGQIIWEYRNEEEYQYITPGALFCIEETDPPDGYIAADPVYGYIPMIGLYPWEDGSSGVSLPTVLPSEYLPLFEPFAVSSDTETGIDGDEVTYYTGHVYISDVKTTSLEIRKVDDERTPLEGAVFGLYEDAECTKLVKQGLEIQGGIHLFGNLEKGQYYIKEITAPEGYRPLKSVLSVEVAENDAGDITITTSEGSDAWQPGEDSDGYYISVVNQSGYALPETGGTGAVPYMAGGMLLILSAGVTYVIMRRKEGRKT